jgi:hypothetical protein
MTRTSRPPLRAADEALALTLRKHVGHQVRCLVEKIASVNHTTRTVSATDGVETVSIRCDTCGEVVLEAVRRVKL